jgi:MFS family permease
MVNPLLSLYTRLKFQGTPSEIALVFFAFSLTSLTTRFFVAAFVRPQYLKFAIVLGSFSMGIAPILYVFSPSFGFFISFRALHGLGSAIMWPTIMTMVSLSVDRERLNKAFALQSAFAAFGMMIAPAFASITSALAGISGTFAVAGIMGLSGFAMAGSLRLKRVEEVRDSATQEIRRLLGLIRRKDVLASSLSFISVSLLANAFFAYGPILAKDEFNLTDSVIALIFFGYSAVSFAVRLSLLKLGAQSNIELLIAAGLISNFIFAVLASLSPNSILFSFLLALLGIGHGLTYPLNAILLALRTNIEERVPVNTLFQAFWDLGIIIGPSLASAFVYLFDVRTGLLFTSFAPVFGSLAMLLSYLTRSYRSLRK